MSEVVGWLGSIWELHTQMALWLLLGFLFSFLLSAAIPASWVNRHLSKPGWGSIWKASLLGVPLPLCSCSVIPTGLGLMKRGASKAATMSFITSTPQTGVESFILAGGLFGWPFALAKAFSAFLMGLVVGGILPKEQNAKIESSEVLPPRSNRELLYFSFVELPATLFKPYGIGVIVSVSLMSFIEPGQLSDWAGSGVWQGIGVLLFSIPLYLCATASIPLGLALLHQGLNLGSVAIFLIAGPATNLISILMISKVMGRRITALYLMVIVLGSLILAFGVDQLIPVGELDLNLLHDHDHAGLLDHLSGVLLLALFSWPFIKRNTSKKCAPTPPGMVDFDLQGLTCGGCVAKLSSALEQDGIKLIHIDTQSLRVNREDAQRSEQAILRCGFKSKVRTSAGNCCP